VLDWRISISGLGIDDPWCKSLEFARPNTPSMNMQRVRSRHGTLGVRLTDPQSSRTVGSEFRLLARQVFDLAPFGPPALAKARTAFYAIFDGTPPWRHPRVKWHLPKVDTPLERHLNQVAFLDATTFGRWHLP
jgi:hypothetical protein